MRGASAFSEGGGGGGPGARCPLEAPSLMTPCPTPAWPPPRTCLLMPAGTLQGPLPAQSTRCPLETTPTLRRAPSASGMCRVFSPCTDLPLAPYPPRPHLSSLSLHLSISQEPPTQYIHDQGTLYPNLPPQYTASLPTYCPKPSLQLLLHSALSPGPANSQIHPLALD